MDERNDKGQKANGADMWREYAANYGVITARIICHRYLDMQERSQAGNSEEMAFCRQLRGEMASAFNMADVTVYRYSEGLAMLNGESELYKDSNKVNHLCAGDIDEAVHASEFGDGTHDFKSALNALADQYGLERVRFVLACEVRFDSVFGRYPGELYKWARDMNINESYGSFGVRTRPDVLTELISELSREEKHMDLNKFPSKEAVAHLREQYPLGTRVELVSMNDPYTTLKPGDRGVIDFIDDTGSVFVSWDNGSKLGLVYGVDLYKKIEPEIVRNAQDLPDGTRVYTLSELMEIMEPQAQRDLVIMRDCVAGLGLYAGLIAKDNGNSSKMAEINLLIGNLVQYWGLDDYENARPLEDFLQAYEDKVEAVKSGAEVADYEYYRKSCADIISGLYRNGQDLVVSQGDSAMSEILEMSDLIKEVAEYFDFETDITDTMTERLVSKVSDMLKDITLPGQAIIVDKVHNYEVEQAVLFDNDRGFAVAHNPNAPAPFVTWQMTNNDGVLDYYWGHYFGTEEKALVDYISRVVNYEKENGVKEKPLHLPEVETDAPEPPKRLIRFIDSDYKELFQIPDGGSIRVTYPPGDGREPAERSCKFLDEYHTNVGGNIYHICEWAERMEALGAKYEPLSQLQSLELVPFTAGTSEDVFYKPNREENNSCVGILTGNFGNSGDRYNSDWRDLEKGNYTAAFQAEMQSVIYALRQDLLKDHNSMISFCENHPEARLPESKDYAIYGFKIQTDDNQYFVRCFAEKDSRFAVYAYDGIPAPVIAKTEVVPSAEQQGMRPAIGDIHPEKNMANNNSGYTSVMKAIEDGQKTPKAPRKSKEQEHRKIKNEEL